MKGRQNLPSKSINSPREDDPLLIEFGVKRLLLLLGKIIDNINRLFKDGQSGLAGIKCPLMLVELRQDGAVLKLQSDVALADLQEMFLLLITEKPLHFFFGFFTKLMALLNFPSSLVSRCQTY